MALRLEVAVFLGCVEMLNIWVGGSLVQSLKLSCALLMFGPHQLHNHQCWWSLYFHLSASNEQLTTNEAIYQGLLSPAFQNPSSKISASELYSSMHL